MFSGTHDYLQSRLSLIKPSKNSPKVSTSNWLKLMLVVAGDVHSVLGAVYVNYTDPANNSTLRYRVRDSEKESDVSAIEACFAKKIEDECQDVVRSEESCDKYTGFGTTINTSVSFCAGDVFSKYLQDCLYDTILKCQDELRPEAPFPNWAIALISVSLASVTFLGGYFGGKKAYSWWQERQRSAENLHSTTKTSSDEPNASRLLHRQQRMI